jgi:hypothetical protein
MAILKATKDIESHQAGQEITLDEELFLSEVEKGVHKVTKRPISMFINHCEVVKASQKESKAYAEIARDVRPYPNVDMEKQKLDPFNKQGG